MKLFDRLFDFQNRRIIERFTGVKPAPTTFSEEWIQLPEGVRIYCHIHQPKSGGAHPGIVIVPGGKGVGTDYDISSFVTADDIASVGFTVLHYDPSGRGRSGGVEDYWGKSHQRELSLILRKFSNMPCVAKEDLGVVSFSIGVTIASGALARFPGIKVRYFFDWEGPSNRHNITKNDTHLPLKDFPSSDAEFWDEREAARYMGNISPVYFRYQAKKDHVQGGNKSHAIELVNLATRGGARWTRLNDNPKNMVMDADNLDDSLWISDHLNHKGTMLKSLIRLHAESG